MKKVIALALGALLFAGALTGCSKPAEPTPQGGEGGDKAQNITIKVGASVAPHSEILGAAKETLAEQGITLEIVEFTDYIQPNLALEQGELDANYFQHQPYLTDFNEKNNTNLVPLGNVHYEPMGIYAGKTKALADLADGAKVAVPNDPTNEARALLLLEANGLIKINPDAGLTATKLDIIENPKNLDIVEVEAAQVMRALEEVEVAVINGNYVTQAGMDVLKDSLAREEADSTAAQTYANIVAVRAGDETRPELVALVDALHTETVKAFITDNYQGSVSSLD